MTTTTRTETDARDRIARIHYRASAAFWRAVDAKRGIPEARSALRRAWDLRDNADTLGAVKALAMYEAGAR